MTILLIGTAILLGLGLGQMALEGVFGRQFATQGTASVAFVAPLLVVLFVLRVTKAIRKP